MQVDVEIHVNSLENILSICGKKKKKFNPIEIKFWQFYWIALEAVCFCKT